MKYTANHNIMYSCKYHVVWCVKYRRKVLVDGIDVRLKEILQTVSKEYQIDIINMDIAPDYVHLLIEVTPPFGIHKAVKLLKRQTSRLLRQEFLSLRSRVPSLWTNSYFVSTVGGNPSLSIKQYIEKQKHI